MVVMCSGVIGSLSSSASKYLWVEGFEGGEEAFRLAPSVCGWDSVVGPKVGLINRSDVAYSTGDCAEGVTVQGQVQCEAAKGVVLPFL